MTAPTWPSGSSGSADLPDDDEHVGVRVAGNELDTSAIEQNGTTSPPRPIQLEIPTPRSDSERETSQDRVLTDGEPRRVGPAAGKNRIGRARDHPNRAQS